MLGIDIVDIEQVKQIYQKHGRLFLGKVLNDVELSELPEKVNRRFFEILSCYIASKEATFKACPEEELDWKDISIQNITKNPLVYIRKPGFGKEIKLSVSINKDIVLSQAMIVGN